MAVPRLPTRHEADDARSIIAQARLEGRSRYGRRMWSLAIVLAVATGSYGAWVLVPIYVDDYSIQDACREALRASTEAPIDVAAFGEEQIRRTIPKQDVQVDRVALDTSGAERALQLEYTRFVEVLPGLRYPWRFRHSITDWAQ